MTQLMRRFTNGTYVQLAIQMVTADDVITYEILLVCFFFRQFVGY